MTDSTGVFLYSRVMTFADCSRMSLPADLLPLCTTVPPDQRPIAQAYIWTPASPLTAVPPSRCSPRCPTGSPSGSPSRPSRRSRSTTRGRCGTTRCGPSSGTARSSPTRRPTTPTCSGTSSLHIPGSPYGGYSSPAAYYARGDPPTGGGQPVRRGHPGLPALRLAAWHGLRADPAGRPVRDRRGAGGGGRDGDGAPALAVLGGADRGAGRDRRVRLPLRHHRGAVRLPSRRGGVRPGAPRAPRRGRRPGPRPGRCRPRPA